MSEALTSPDAIHHASDAEALFDPTPLPHRPVQWRRGMRILAEMRHSKDPDRIMGFSAAMEGDDGERAFQEFLREPESARLLRERPRLEHRLDDFDALARLPADSLGQAYRRLAQRDSILATALVEGERALPDEAERAPDLVRRWYRGRMVATHDLLHVLTGYERDHDGEVRLIAFSLAAFPKLVFRVALVLGVLGTPLREWPGLPRALWTAWKRGRATRIPRATDWEGLLALPLDEARARLDIAA